ncbi:MAG: DUF6663 family protein [Haloferacaceae archaeon]
MDREGSTASTDSTPASGRFRVYPPLADGRRPFVDAADCEPTDVRVEADHDLAAGWLVDATLAWADGGARAVDVSPVRETTFAFADGVTDLYEVARETFRAAERAGDGLNARVTRNTDGDPNGAVYTFASPPGRDLFAEFRRGRRPIEPLLRRVTDERGPGERAVFVLRPANEPFVVVQIALRRDGLLARTMRETYL